MQTQMQMMGGNVLELQARMDEGATSARELARFFCERVERFDAHLNAVIAIDPDAIETARALDDERSRSGPRSWIHGAPLLVKDNIETCGALPTTAGSLALRDNHVDRDAPVVAALREAGAVILGKANLSEWANFRSMKPTSGWSAVGGQSRNPYDPTRSPCGSSSGSAIAVAAQMAVAAIGTETAGSIVSPASMNGVVGFKPAVGELSQLGIVPISHSQDTAGPLARCVIDAIVLTAIMGRSDPSSLIASLTDVTAPVLLEHRRIGVIECDPAFQPEVEALFEAARSALCDAGAELVEGLAFETPKGFRRAAFDVLLYEFKHGLNAYLATLPGEKETRTLSDVIEFNASNADAELSNFGQDVFELSNAKLGLDDPRYREALALVQRATRDDGIDAVMEQHGLDALMAPTIGPAWPIDYATGDAFGASCPSHAAIAGYPHLTLPMGDVGGLPIGLSLFGRPSDRDTLLQLSRGYELIAPPRRWPVLG